MLGISKRGDSYIRTLLIHGGRSVVRCAHKHQDKRSQWIGEVEKRRGKNITAVAVANKNARIVWALLTKKKTIKLKRPKKGMNLRAQKGLYPLAARLTPASPGGGIRKLPAPANRVMSDLGMSRTTRRKRLRSSLTCPNPTKEKQDRKEQ